MSFLSRLVFLGLVVAVDWNPAAYGRDGAELLERPVLTNPAGIVASAGQRSLVLVSLNLAHGRGDGWNQWLVSEAQIRRNLDRIAEFLLRTRADLVALQEADAPSPWSGRFDHVAYLAARAGFPFYVFTPHASIVMGTYGTALLSRQPVREGAGMTFSPSWPTARKGFSLAEIRWRNPDAPGGELSLDVVSVHLDFSRKSVRRKQIDELVAALGPRRNPLVILGDFNSEWLARQYTLDSFASSAALHAYSAGSEALATYQNRRLDWVLASRDLVFDNYRVEPAVMSDHRAVVTTISLLPEEGS